MSLMHRQPTPREVHRALRYVLLNARKHAKRARAADSGSDGLDEASSARWFDGWRKMPRSRDDAASTDESRPVASARWWLLRLGRRRHGLLDPADVPGVERR